MSEYLTEFEAEMLKSYRRLPGAKVEATCPENCGSFDERIPYVIMHLNDLHEWPREKIADWVDSLSESGIDLSFKEPDG